MRKYFANAKFMLIKKFLNKITLKIKKQLNFGVLLLFSQNKISHKVFYCKKFANVLYFLMLQVFEQIHFDEKMTRQ